MTLTTWSSFGFRLQAGTKKRGHCVIRNKAAERSTRRPVIVALRGGELASVVAKRCLPCRSTGCAGLSEARRVAVVSGQRSPTTKAYARADVDQAALLPYRKGCPVRLGVRQEERRHRPCVGYAASLSQSPCARRQPSRDNARRAGDMTRASTHPSSAIVAGNGGGPILPCAKHPRGTRCGP